MATIDGSKYFNPFYREVDGEIKTELDRRASAYGSRVRSGTVSSDSTGFPEAAKVLWSYGKTAYAIVSGRGGIVLGSSYSRVMSDNNGNLTLYDSTRNQPKYPLLQSVEITNEGQLGSLIKGNFTFTVYPDLFESGFNMSGIEEAFFVPGEEVNIKYGWSVRDTGVNNGSLTGIIHNFDWSVNPDLSITAKCHIVSKATIAIGVSGEQTTPGGDDAQKDPLGQPIPNGDIAGVIEWDIKNLGGINNKSVSLGKVGFYEKSKTRSKRLNYYVIGMPMSLVDLDNSVLSQQQQQQKQQYQNQQKLIDQKNQAVDSEAGRYEKDTVEYEDYINRASDTDTAVVYNVADANGNITQKTGSKAEAQASLQQWKEFKKQRIIARYEKIQIDNKVNMNSKAAIQAREDFYNEVVKAANKASAAKKAAATGVTGSTVPKTTQPGPFGAAKTPPPVTHPIYYIKLGDLTEYVNEILKGSPIGDELFVVQCFGNTTEHLPDIVSSAPEEVFFPDEEMGRYGGFAPFSAGGTAGFLKAKAPPDSNNKPSELIDIANILISTTAVIKAYRGLVKENQTSIEYKNITGFFDELIKLVNYASGEMYQLTTQLIDPPKGGSGKARLCIEDSNLSKAVIESVTPYKFVANISRPLLKSISISCKPPGPSAAASFTLGRAGGGSTQTDVRFDKDGNPIDLEGAKKQIESEKNSFVTKGAGKTFSTGMKGNFSKYKRAKEYDPQLSGAHWLRKVIYPLDLSLTIDGIDGFKFGDILSTNLIPSKYNRENMVFVVTKITHTIQNGVWETTLNTKSRIEPQTSK